MLGNIGEYIIFGILLLPILILIIYTIIYPEKAASWGYKWRFNGEPEPTEGYIQYTRASGIIGLIIIISILINAFESLIGIMFFIVSIFITVYYFLTK